MTIAMLLGYLLIGASPVLAHAFTQASVYDYTGIAPYSLSDSHHVNASIMADNFLTTWITQSHDSADAYFGNNGVHFDFEYDSLMFDPDPNYATIECQASYNLSWFSPNNNESGEIINWSLSTVNSIHGQLIGTFEFLYGMPYEINSSLSICASCGGVGSAGGSADVNSVWEDVFTFFGKPEGTEGIASLCINMNGSISSDKSVEDSVEYGWMWEGPWSVTKYIADFSNGATWDTIILPKGTQMISQSGTAYHIPESFAVLYLILGIIGLGGLKRFFRCN